jgi:ABC-type antimicrobial peptide transport system permease subunit
VAVGIAAVSAMVGTAATVSYGLGTGFERTASRADLPDVLARFDDRPAALVDRKLRALPGIEARSYRRELTGVSLVAGRHWTGKGAVEEVLGRRRGYALVDGRDLTGRPGEVLVERGLARAWRLGVGDWIDLAGLGRKRVVGVVVPPENVAFPLASVAHVFVARGAFAGRAATGDEPVNVALVWLRSPSAVDEVLTQARETSYGLTRLRFVTRDGIRTLIGRAGGIVTALLAAFSVVAVAAAGVMLVASARLEVARELETIGVLRALGLSRTGVTLRYAGRAARVALPAAAIGVIAGALLARGPVADLLVSLNQLPPGWGLVFVLAACLAAIVAVVCVATAWPAWRAASQPPATILRGAELRTRPRRTRLRGGVAGLGVRVVAARPVRLAATVASVALSAAVVLQLLALASLLQRLESEPSAVGKRYQLTAELPPEQVPRVRALPGVADAAPRYEVDAADSFALDQSLRLIAYDAPPANFESPPLVEGRRAARAGEATIGLGLAQALGLRRGSTLVVQLASGREARLRVTGVVMSLENDGRIAYARAVPALRSDPALPTTVAIRLSSGASEAAVSHRLSSLAPGAASPTPATGATSRNVGFLGTLAALLRLVAAVNGLVCLYVLVQALGLVAIERRPTIALLRAVGSSGGQIALVFGGAGLAVAALAAPLAALLERLVLGPAVGSLAADYVALPLASGVGQIVLVALGVGALALAAAATVARRIQREPVVLGLRAE